MHSEHDASEVVLTEPKIGSTYRLNIIFWSVIQPFHCFRSLSLSLYLSLPQATFPALYQSLCLSDSDLWLSFSRSSQCEQEIPSSIAKKITSFQQVSSQSKTISQMDQLLIIYSVCQKSAPVRTLAFMCRSAPLHFKARARRKPLHIKAERKHLHLKPLDCV